MKMNMQNLLAKSDGTKLIKHSTEVSRIGEMIFDKIGLTGVRTKKLKELTRIACLLHDIGKANIGDQTLYGPKTPKKSKNDYYHNEIGWAFLCNFLKMPPDDLKIVLHAIYWHHGISNEMSKNHCDTILEGDCDENKGLQKNDIKKMKELLVTLLDESYLKSPLETECISGERTPNFYIDVELKKDDINIELMLVRSVLISADRLVSSTDSEINDIDNIINKTPYTIGLNDKYESSRLLEQIKICNVASTSTTTILNAPCGFGKTLMGLIWGGKSNKKIIWVCPRNSVGVSVYDSIIKEIDKLNLNLTVELYLTGVKQNSNRNSDKDFDSDIIITNIDNYLSPSLNNSNADRLFLINNADVIFDEYHELVTNAPMFSLFAHIMNLRHRLVKSRTLLLSATPLPISHLWDTAKNKTKILPSKDSHYVAIHTEEYQINFSSEMPKNVKINDSTLVNFNSIKNTQKNINILNCDEIIHSDYIKTDKDAKLNTLLSQYGKSSDYRKNKGNWISSPIIQSSLDVSFKNLHEVLQSPQKTLQLLGRCNRYGYHKNSKLYFYSSHTNLSENSTVKILYNEKLNKLWVDEIRDLDTKKLTLDGFYKIYNDFNVKNEDDIKRYIKVLLRVSFNELIKNYPFRFNNKGNSNVMSANGNRLRTSSNNKKIFCISKIHGSEEYCDPICTTIYQNIDKDLGEKSNTHNRIVKVFKLLKDDNRFDYNKIKNVRDITLDTIRKFAKKSDTPYVRFDKVYHRKYGLIDKDILTDIK